MKLRGDRCVFAGEMQDLGLPLRGEMWKLGLPLRGEMWNLAAWRTQGGAARLSPLRSALG